MLYMPHLSLARLAFPRKLFMAYTLIIAEKASVGRDVAAWLATKHAVPANPVGRSHIEVGAYVVSWLSGHVLENVEPHAYDPRYKSWSAADLPIIPEVFLLAPKDRLISQIETLKRLLKSAKAVIGLGDPDGEGQLLQDEFLLWAGVRVPVQRLWLSSTDDMALEKAWAAMKPNSEYAGYYWSALARSHADWLAGINLSRACTLASQHNGGNATLSIGRVQTPTLGLIVQREKEIRSFKPVSFYTPFLQLATTPGFKASWAPDKETDARLDEDGRLLKKEVAESIAAGCLKAKSATVTTVKATRGSEAPPLPFALSTLQELMSRKYGMSVADTLKHAQTLYEKKVASYPRVDTEYLPEDHHADAPVILKHLAGLAGVVKELGGAPSKANPALKSKAFNDKKVTAHFAISPRPATPAQIAALSAPERLVWLEIARRYLLQFFPTAEFLSTEILLTCAGEPFKASGKVFTLRGWKDAFSADVDEDDAAPALPKVVKGDVLLLATAGFDSGATKAPKRYTDGTLLVAMKNVHRYVADPKLKAILKENIGIGTEATRANVIEELFNRHFIELVKKDIKPTALGEQLIDALPRQISAPDMTALWQQAMNDIMASKEAGYKSFISAQSKWLHELVREVPSWFRGKALVLAGKAATAKSSSMPMKASSFKCTKAGCGAMLIHIEGKFGKFFGCPSCKENYKDVDGKPVAKTPPPSGTLSIDGVSAGDACPKCKKGTMNARVCGPHTRAPGKTFLSCSRYFEKDARNKCDHSIWPK